MLSCLHFSGENTETFSSLTSYPELRRSEFLIGGYVGARASLLSTAPHFVTMTQELVARGDTLRIRRSKSLAFVGRPTRSVILTLRSRDTRRQNLVIPHPFAIQTQSCPMARRDKIWSFCTLCHPEAAGPMTCRDKIWSFRTPLPFRHSRVRWRAETKFDTVVSDGAQRQNLVILYPLSSRGGGPDDMRRQNLVIPHPFAVHIQSCPMARRDKIWSFCTLCHPEAAGPMTCGDKIWSFRTPLPFRRSRVRWRAETKFDTVVSDGAQRQNLVILYPLSSRGGGPDDMRRQNLVIPHPFAVHIQSCPMARRDKIWSFCTLCHPEAAGPMTCGDKIWSFRTPLPFRRSRVRWRAETKFDTVVSDGAQRQNLVILHPLSSRGGGPDDMRRQNLVIPHPFAIQIQSCPMARRDKIWSFCTLCHPEAAGPMTCGDKIWSFRTPLPFRHSRVRWRAETKFGHSAPFKAVASGGSNLARLGELGGNHLPYFAINRGGSEKEKAEALPKRFRNVFREEFRNGFDRSSTFFIRSSSFFDLQRVSTSNQAIRFVLCTRGGTHCVSCIFILVSFTFYTPS
ncbi:hypothetical protein HKD37_01G001508 [Glycine soja]